MTTKFNEVVFQFKPGDNVKVKAFDLNYNGRIVRCIYARSGYQYDIDYADDKGCIVQGTFWEEELCLR